jgi:hypothetical protein
MQTYSLAPIVLFTYNRPLHTQRCLESLHGNTLSFYSTLYIFCDGPKIGANKEELEKIAQIEQLVSSKKWCGNVIIHKHAQNIGLRNSIISGINSVINKHGRVIVLEDDLILSPYFLEYMNNGLETYKNEPNVCQISGFSFNLDVRSVQEDAYFLPLTTTWGWATWKRIWHDIDFDGKDYKAILYNENAIRQFNLNNSYNYYDLLLKQVSPDSTVSSWGIMFWLNAFKNNYITLFPKNTLVNNEGFDGSGRHGANEKSISSAQLETNRSDIFPMYPVPNEMLFKQLKKLMHKQEHSVKKRLVKLYKKVLAYL